MSSYKDLDIYKISLELFYIVHPSSLKLPKYEMYELGSQLRRSSDSIVTNIVEGYGRKKYKAEFVRFCFFLGRVV
jgi:four helix bundle protein